MLSDCIRRIGAGLPGLHGPCWRPEHSDLERTFTSLVLSLVFCASVAGQRFTIVDDDKLPRFASVSITPGDPDSRAGGITWPSGRFVQDNADMRSAVTLAFFGVWPYQLPTTLPGPLRDRYSIDARMPDGAIESRYLMIRALLIDRFKMRFHLETREQDGFALTLLRNDGQLGPNMRHAMVDCVARSDAQRRNETVPPLPVGTRCGMDAGPGRFNISGMDVSVLLQSLENEVGKPVVNRTGLTGAVDVT